MNTLPVAPLVSVIIPIYNGERFLRQAVVSVLSQEYAPIEVIVVDDGSRDASATIARGFGPPVTCLSQANGGAASARNAGVEASRGELIAFLDADDLWLPGKLHAQVDALSEDPELACVFGLVEHVSEGEEAAGLEVHVAADAAGLAPGTMLIRREAFFRVGLFKLGLVMGEFLDWYARATELGLHSKVLPQRMLQRRLHAGNTSRGLAASRTDYLHVLRAALERRRRTPQ